MLFPMNYSLYTRALLLPCLLFAPVAALCLPAGADANAVLTGPASDATARAAFRDLMTAVSSADSVAYDVAMHLESKMADRVTVNDMTATVVLRGEKEAYLEAVSGADRVEVYSDGEEQQVYFEARKQYADIPAPPLRSEVVGAISGGLMREASLWLGRFLHGAEEVVDEASFVDDQGETEIDGESFRAFQVSYPLYDLVLHAAPEVPRLRRLVLELDRGIAALSAPPGVTGGTVTLDFTNWSINTAIPDERFTFVAPEGVTKWNPAARSSVPGMEMLGGDAPDFELGLLTGGVVKLSDHKEKSVVLLDFFASWCGPCRMGLPVVSDIAKDYADKDVAFYAVNVRESAQKAERFVNELEIELPVLLDLEGVVQRLYQASGIPRTVIVGKDGTIQAIHAGFSPYLAKKIKEDLDALLAGNTLADPA